MTSFKKFYPHMTRAALTEVAAAWPLEGGLPSGLQALFELLEQMALEDVGPWGKGLNDNQIDNLCHYFNKAPNSRVLLAIALILTFRRDLRAGQVLHLFMHFMPVKSELEFLGSIWEKQQVGALVSGEAAWIAAYMEEETLPPVLRYVIDQLRRDNLTFDQLGGDFAQITPLFEALLDFIFSEGRELIAKVNPKLASEMAIENLRKGRDQKTHTYINHYPEMYWKPEFLDALHQFKGSPDPAASSFYAEVSKGRIWGLRKKLFEHKLSGSRLSKERQVFWGQWVHRMRDWQEADGVVQISIGPYVVRESPGKSTLTSAQSSAQMGQEIPMDHNWERRMEEILTEVLQWGEV